MCNGDSIKGSFGAEQVDVAKVFEGLSKQADKIESDNAELLNEIKLIDAKLEALLDVLVVKGLIREPDFMIACNNLMNFMPNDTEQFEAFLVRRRNKLANQLID